MKQLFFVILLFFLLGTGITTGQHVVINEIAANNCSIADNDADFSDWIELHNLGPDPENLTNYSLTDDIDIPTKWTFSTNIMNAGTYQFLWASGKDIKEKTFYRTIVTQGDSFRYVVPNAVTSLNWKKSSFDDMNWNNGVSGFGYGDGDDDTFIAFGTESIFLRKTITINDLAELKSIIFHMDYDDGFVAYLNETEIARANISADSPSYNEQPDGYVEPKLINNEKLEVFEITDFLDIIQEGENTLAIQVHNYDSNSSDFTAIPFVSLGYQTNKTVGIDPPEFLDLQENQLHTNFKISAKAETIYLYDAEQQLIDSLHIENITPDVTVGRIPGDSKSVVYFTEGTPNETNQAFGYEGVVNSLVEFSHPGGLTENLALTLSTDNITDEIRYTLDATLPNSSSLLYINPLEINENIVVKTRVFRQNFIPSIAQNKTYITAGESTIPVVNIVTEPDNLWDYNTGIYANGPGFTLQFPHFGANFWEDWEIPVHISYYENSDDEGVFYNAGAKIFGGYSRAFAQKSMSLFARSKYGDKKFDYPFFATRNYDDFEALVLRNNGNDWLRANLRDITMTGLMDHSGIDIQAHQQTNVYINGAYWGHYNLREKVNEHFLASRHDVDPDSIDLLFGQGEIIEGDNVDYFELIDFLENNDLDNQANFDYVANKIDIPNFTLYQLANIYLDNKDWPGNNIKFWKPKNGKWKWIMYDTDFGLGIWDVTSYFANTLRFALDPDGPDWPNPPWSNILIRKLLDNDNYQQYFINYFADEINSRFLPENIHQEVDKNKEILSPEVLKHFTRWNSSPNEWSMEVENMKTFATFRPENVKEDITIEFDLPDYHELSIENDQVQAGFVKVNDRLSIESAQWSGDYFENNIFTVRAVPRQGYAFSHWEGDIDSEEIELFININSPITVIPVFIVSTSEASVVINEINYKSSDDKDAGDWVEVYNNSAGEMDISAWDLKDSDDEHEYIFPEGTVLAPYEFLIIARSIDKFQLVFPDVDVFDKELDYGLGSEEDIIRLYNADGILHDSVHYLSTNPWPEEPNGTGATLQLKSPYLDNSIAENWFNFYECGTPGKQNLDATTTEGTDIGSQVTILPNPVNETLTLKIEEIFTDKNVSFDVLNLDGKAIFHLFEGSVNGTDFLMYNVEHLIAGVYILQIQENNRTLGNLRFVKM